MVTFPLSLSTNPPLTSASWDFIPLFTCFQLCLASLYRFFIFSSVYQQHWSLVMIFWKRISVLLFLLILQQRRWCNAAILHFEDWQESSPSTDLRCCCLSYHILRFYITLNSILFCFLFLATVDPPWTRTSRKRPLPISDRQSKTPKLSQSKPYICNL